MKSAEGRRYSDRDRKWYIARELGGRSRSCWQSSGWLGIRDGVAVCVLWDLFWKDKTEAISLALRHRNEKWAQSRNGLLHQLDLISITFSLWNLRDYIKDLKKLRKLAAGGRDNPPLWGLQGVNRISDLLNHIFFSHLLMASLCAHSDIWGQFFSRVTFRVMDKQGGWSGLHQSPHTPLQTVGKAYKRLPLLDWGGYSTWPHLERTTNQKWRAYLREIFLSWFEVAESISGLDLWSESWGGKIQYTHF